VLGSVPQGSRKVDDRTAELASIGITLTFGAFSTALLLVSIVVMRFYPLEDCSMSMRQAHG